MNANELRIGNYYSNNGSIETVTPNTIIDVWESERTWCKPLDLTESWLLKFGFEKVTDYQFRKGKRLIMKRDCLFYDYGTDVKIEFVHKLQNLYFELNEDLTLI